MKVHDAIEQAYKNGYEAGKRDARKKGRWLSWYSEPILQDDGFYDWTCSECNTTLSFEEIVTVEDFASNFCPNCGHKKD